MYDVFSTPSPWSAPRGLPARTPKLDGGLDVRLLGLASPCMAFRSYRYSDGSFQTASQGPEPSPGACSIPIDEILKDDALGS